LIVTVAVSSAVDATITVQMVPVLSTVPPMAVQPEALIVPGMAAVQVSAEAAVNPAGQFGVQPVNVTGVVPGTTVPVGQIGLCLSEQSIAVPLPPGVMPQVDDSMLTAEPVVMS
jgi:hypothetical protein